MRLEDIAEVKFPVDARDIADSLRTDAFYAVLQGLPRLEFTPSKTSSGSNGLRYEKDGNYIWVTPSAAQAAHENPNAVLIAWVYRKGHGNKLFVRDLDTPKSAFGDTLDSTIYHAKELMTEAIQEKRKR